MRELVAPNWDAFDDYEAIVSRSVGPNKVTREAYRDDVRERYQAYLDCAPDLENMVSVVAEGPPRDAHMRSCYGHEHMRDVKHRISALQRDPYLLRFCQFCGGMAVVSQWDHYLPQAEFPEFAACAYNITPICGVCNHTKRERGTTQGAREVVHVFYDDIPSDLAYLEATIVWSAEGPDIIFSPSMPAGGDQQFFALFCRHVDALALEDRFADYYRIQLEREAKKIAKSVRRGLELEVIRDLLRDSAESEPGGPSSPLAALLRAAADSDRFLEYAASGAGQ
ncbi:hypothetical protein G6O69_05195 [Pseudenhygromyxa sp. WMMC2535]|uniref:hypothetical protein n=1 Tax=Pseudenhygromyxa sp. WMMC2535 TaxID=2712867 RepID=UPI001553B3DF|nr:hypothetical protein [Pseudenhygromyxa sp. WMMC2535]NVB37216.1 hypothetical protein [Pseudenhygromyxa sp. WMMC2535]